MKQSCLQHKGIYFTKIEISAQPEAEPLDFGKVNVKLNVHCERHKDSASSWFLMVTIDLQHGEGFKASYVGKVEVCGGFELNLNCSEEAARKLVYVNGAGILYTAAREMITNLTARGFYPALTIPTCSFLDMFTDEQESTKQPSLPFKELVASSAASEQP